MKALFGAVSLLVVLAIVGFLAVRQLRAVGSSLGAAGQPAAAVGTGGAVAATTAAPAASNVREQSQQLQQRVTNDVTKALEQGAATRQEEPVR